MDVPTTDGIFQPVTAPTAVIVFCDGEHQQLVIMLTEFP